MHPGQRPTCQVSTVPKQMHVYDFSRFNYTGRKTYRGMWVDEWQLRANRTLITYIDRVGTEEPVMFSFQVEGHHPEVIHFWEFDQGPQSPWIFNVSYEFPGVCRSESSVETQSSEQPKPLLDPQICQKAASIAQSTFLFCVTISNIDFDFLCMCSLLNDVLFCIFSGKATCGCPYVWGGTSCGCNGQGGFDCSGLTYYSYRSAGWHGIARTAAAQAQQGGSCGSCSPSNTEPCKPGDLFFYDFPEDTAFGASPTAIDHVVMYIGGNRVAECPHPGLDCRVISPYSTHYVTCRRFC